MTKFKKIIFIIYIFLFLNLFFSQNLLSTVIVFIILNLFLSIFSKLKPKNINKILLFELACWFINCYWVINSNSEIWFLALNNLLWLLTSIKLIEVKNNINAKNIIFLLLLSVGSSTLFNLGFLSNLISILLLFLLLYSLLILNSYRNENIFKQLIILITFLPLTLISFINIPSPKPWLNFNAKTFAKTGISNELRPGDISSLAQSEDLVGRVYFKESLPKPENRYWRLFVLDHFENNTWVTSDNQKFFLVKKSIENNNSGILDNEKWIVEPNYIKQRPWSGRGYLANSDLSITNKGVLMASKELNKRENYKISNSYDIWRKIPPNKPNKSFEEIKNKSLYKLSRKWSEESSNTEEIVEKAKQFFQKENFIYSINPGLMNNDSPYDDFLFRKKKGFCEHFAGSFALLMRYADIPVRVVIGYQGGEFMTDSQNNKFFLIDNSFAHAWNEIWIMDKGWVRVDPTSWVSPERIQESSLLGNRSNTRFINLRSTFNLNLITNVTKLEVSFNKLIDKVNTKFEIFKFSKNKILNRFYSIIFFLLVLIFSVVSILLLEIKTKRNLIRFTLDIYIYFLNIFKLKIKDGETLKSFSLRIEKIHPQIKPEIEEIYKLYYSYKFKNKKLSFYGLLVLFFKITFTELKVLISIAIKNFSHKNI